VVKNNSVVIVLGCKDKELTKKRVKFAESMLKNSNDIKVIFSGTKEEIGWMKNNSKLKAIQEDKSTTTPQNLINSKSFIENEKKVFIVTDKSHAFRTRYLAKRILKGKTIEIMGVKMPAIYMIKQIWYEGSRLIKHVFGIE
jgi:uncharacterized SAM-binding protein YcdF (DUF218 family)